MSVKFIGLRSLFALDDADTIKKLFNLNLGIKNEYFKEWLEFNYNDKPILIASLPILFYIPWDELQAKGCVTGQTKIKLREYDNELFHLRLLRHTFSSDPINEVVDVLKEDEAQRLDSEWLQYYLALEDETLKNHYGRVPTWCIETDSVDTGKNRIIRGFKDPGALLSVNSSRIEIECGWRPVLEMVN